MKQALPAIDSSQIKDPQLRAGMLLLRAEIKRLQAGRGKPEIKANKAKTAAPHSSGEGRRPQEGEQGKEAPEIRPTALRQ